MHHDRPPKRPLVGEIGKLEEMDVCLSMREYRELLASEDLSHTRRLLSGDYSLEPWVRVRMGDDWMLTAGIEVLREDDQA